MSKYSFQVPITVGEATAVSTVQNATTDAIRSLIQKRLFPGQESKIYNEIEQVLEYYENLFTTNPRFKGALEFFNNPLLVEAGNHVEASFIMWNLLVLGVESVEYEEILLADNYDLKSWILAAKLAFIHDTVTANARNSENLQNLRIMCASGIDYLRGATSLLPDSMQDATAHLVSDVYTKVEQDFVNILKITNPDSFPLPK